MSQIAITHQGINGNELESILQHITSKLIAEENTITSITNTSPLSWLIVYSSNKNIELTSHKLMDGNKITVRIDNIATVKDHGVDGVGITLITGEQFECQESYAHVLSLIAKEQP